MSQATSNIRPLALSYLAQGLTQVQVANALNCSESYISQLLAEDEFRAELDQKRAAAHAQVSEYDDKVDRIKGLLLDKIEQTIGMVYRPEPLVAMWSKLSTSHKRQHSLTLNNSVGAQAAATTIVNLQLPPALIDKFTVNSRNQVLQAGDQTLVTLQSTNLEKLAAAHHSKSAALLGGQEDVHIPKLTIDKEDEYGFLHPERAGQEAS